MYRNIIFDVGQVLLSFEPEIFSRTFIKDHEERRSFVNSIFLGQEWSRFDRGILQKEEIISHLKKKYPNWKEIIEKVVGNWEEMLEPIPGTVKILKKIKEMEMYHLFLLSNFPRESFYDVNRKNEFFQLFDGFVVSGEEGYKKPEKEIYQILLKRYSLKAKESLFIDDVLCNIKGGERLGIKGLLYVGSEELHQDLLSLQIIAS